MTRFRFSTTSLVLGTALLLSGCTLLPSLTPQGNATPTPAAVTEAEAVTAWTDTICTFNVGARAFADTWSDDTASLRDLKEAASLGRTEAETAKESLETTGWPTDLDADVDVVIGYVDERIGKLDQVLAAETLDELDPIELASTPDHVNEAATRIEESLALGDSYCPQTEPEQPAEPAPADLSTTTWTGTDSDGDLTEIYFGSAGGAEVSVGDTVYEGAWELVDAVVTINVSTADNSLAFQGFYEDGGDAMSLSGSASNGHTWTVTLMRR